MTSRPHHTTLLRQYKNATTTTRGTPRERMLPGEWFDLRYALLKTTPYDRVEAAFMAAVGRKSPANRDAILEEMESLDGDEQREFVLRTFAGFRPSQR
jgi:hypothetical protein